MTRTLQAENETVAREAWAEWISAGRCQNEPGKREPTDGGEVSAYINEGRWVADCPNCNGGMLTSPVVAVCFCHDCGTIYEAMHPDPESVSGAEKVLANRPVRNRNWYPDREDVADLQAENATRAIPFGAR